MPYIVTGATGHFGRLVVESLLAHGIAPSEIVATGRSVEKLTDLAARGVRVERLDYAAVPASVEWLNAGDVVLLVSGSEIGQRVPQHQAVVDLAARSGAARVVYTSAPSADNTTLAVAPEHAATEALIRASGVPFTFLRNGWYTENYREAFDAAKVTGIVADSAGDGLVASAPRADYAAAAAVALTEAGHEGQTYELFGDAAWSFKELAVVFSEVLDRPVDHESLTADEHRMVLRTAGLDAGLVDFLVSLDTNIGDGLLGITNGQLSGLIGRPTVPLLDTVRTWA